VWISLSERCLEDGCWRCLGSGGHAVSPSRSTSRASVFNPAISSSRISAERLTPRRPACSARASDSVVGVVGTGEVCQTRLKALTDLECRGKCLKTFWSLCWL
jgi:hypothetical protein